MSQEMNFSNLRKTVSVITYSLRIKIWNTSNYFLITKYEYFSVAFLCLIENIKDTEYWFKIETRELYEKSVT